MTLCLYCLNSTCSNVNLTDFNRGLYWAPDKFIIIYLKLSIFAKKIWQGNSNALCVVIGFKDSIVVYKLTRSLSIPREHRTGDTAAMFARDSHRDDKRGRSLTPFQRPRIPLYK